MLSINAPDLHNAYNVIASTVLSLRPEILTAAVTASNVPYTVKSDRVDISTTFDIKIENQIKLALEKIYPYAGFRVEEGVSTGTGEDYVWYIDPIDGTKYFKAGLPGFTCSVGLMYHNDPIFGFIYDFSLNVIYSGWERSPSARNGVKMSVLSSDTPYESTQIVADRAQRYAGWEKDKDWIDSKLRDMSKFFYRERDFGLGALSCAMVAGGLMNMGAIVTLAGESGTKAVDIAAGRALIKYAGGTERIVPVSGLTFSEIVVAGAPQVVEKIAEIINR